MVEEECGSGVGEKAVVADDGEGADVGDCERSVGGEEVGHWEGDGGIWKEIDDVGLEEGEGCDVVEGGESADRGGSCVCGGRCAAVVLDAVADGYEFESEV